MQSRFLYGPLLGVLLALGASAQAIGEYQVKAAFLYNFARFVEWPVAAFSNDKEPFRICVIGRNPFRGALEEAVRAKTVAGRSFVIDGISGPGEAGGCRPRAFSPSATPKVLPHKAESSTSNWKRDAFASKSISKRLSVRTSGSVPKF